MSATFRRDDGKYDYSKLDRLCVCGHVLGDHSAHTPRPCFVGQNTPAETPCECLKFRPSRRK